MRDQKYQKRGVVGLKFKNQDLALRNSDKKVNRFLRQPQDQYPTIHGALLEREFRKESISQENRVWSTSECSVLTPDSIASFDY